MFQELALQIAQKAHAGQVDKAGKDYILHPMTVASYMDTDIEKTIAYLHDVLEDTDVTVDALRKIFPNEIVDTLITLTHRKDESYFEYIQRVSKSKLAKKVMQIISRNAGVKNRIEDGTSEFFRSFLPDACGAIGCVLLSWSESTLDECAF